LTVSSFKFVIFLEDKGKNSIEVNDGDELIQALTKLRDAVLGGELAAQIEIASESVKARFKK
jgi:hypothetical protein